MYTAGKQEKRRLDMLDYLLASFLIHCESMRLEHSTELKLLRRHARKHHSDLYTRHRTRPITYLLTSLLIFSYCFKVYPFKANK